MKEPRAMWKVNCILYLDEVTAVLSSPDYIERRPRGSPVFHDEGSKRAKEQSTHYWNFKNKISLF